MSSKSPWGCLHLVGNHPESSHQPATLPCSPVSSLLPPPPPPPFSFLAFLFTIVLIVSTEYSLMVPLLMLVKFYFYLLLMLFYLLTASLACWLSHPPWEWMIPGSNPAWDGIFPGSSHTSDLKIGTPVATLPGAWRHRVGAGTGWPGVSILWLGEISLICNFYLSVAARKIVWADPSLRYTRMLLGR